MNPMLAANGLGNGFWGAPPSQGQQHHPFAPRPPGPPQAPDQSYGQSAATVYYVPVQAVPSQPSQGVQIPPPPSWALPNFNAPATTYPYAQPVHWGPPPDYLGHDARRQQRTYQRPQRVAFDEVNPLEREQPEVPVPTREHVFRPARYNRHAHHTFNNNDRHREYYSETGSMISSTSSRRGDRRSPPRVPTPPPQTSPPAQTQETHDTVEVQRMVVELSRTRAKDVVRYPGIEDHGSRPPRKLPCFEVVTEVGKKSIKRTYAGLESWAMMMLLSQVGKYEVRAPDTGRKNRFFEPFTDFFYCASGLQQYVKDVDRRNGSSWNREDEEKFRFAEVILEFLSTDAADIKVKFDQFSGTPEPATVEFCNLWMIYRPGALVYTGRTHQEARALMVDRVTYSAPDPAGNGALNPLVLQFWVIDYDGEVFGRRAYHANIPPFPGEKAISDLEFVPERFIRNRNLRSQLEERGREFWRLSGHNYRQVVQRGLSTVAVDGEVRVVVDRATHRKLFGGWTVSNASENEWAQFGNRDNDTVLAVANYSGGPTNHAGGLGDQPGLATTTKSSLREGGQLGGWLAEYSSIDPQAEPDDLTLLLCTTSVKAFSLRDRVWKEYFVADLKPVNFRENAWSRLVLDPEYKDVVQAMVQSYLSKTDNFQDLVPGKGLGLVILLHGPPGVGKTLTAECVAESFRKPLFTVTAGDLGTNPESLERRLSEIFDYTVRWDAILLLDEADIFLQDRDYENLARNALVSVFLRTLEYFNGILFLTSNRVGAFDQAFQSRIHITLGIPEFDQTVRKKVWEIFIKDLGRRRRDGSDPILTPDECRALGREVINSWASQPLNGRQVRNCVRSALALAQDKGERLAPKHLNTVIRLSNMFASYMHKLQKAGGDEVAQIKGDRLADMRSLVAHDREVCRAQEASAPRTDAAAVNGTQ